MRRSPNSWKWQSLWLRLLCYLWIGAHLSLLMSNAHICLADMNHLQGEYRSGSGPHPSEDASVSSVALVTIPITIALLVIIVFLLINQKKQWIPVSCYKAPTKVPHSCLFPASHLSENWNWLEYSVRCNWIYIIWTQLFFFSFKPESFLYLWGRWCLFNLLNNYFHYWMNASNVLLDAVMSGD